MKNRILFVLLVVSSVGLLTWFAIKAQSNERLAIQQNYQNLAFSQLKRIDEKVISYFQQLENILLNQRQQIEQERSANNIRHFLKYSPYILNVYIADKNKKILYPSWSQSLSEKEQQFLSNIRVISHDHALFSAQEEMETDTKQNKLTQSSQTGFTTKSQKLPSVTGISQYQTKSGIHGYGWITWYQERNLHHLFWFKDAQQRLYLLFLDRIRILSDIISLLPDEQLSSDSYNNSLQDMTIRLKNSNNAVIYEWGSYPVTDNKSIDLMLSYPLGSWKLSWYAKFLSEDGFQQQWSLLIIAFFASLVILALMFIIFREYNRELREAGQRVNFVSQVSHELKTPLTNIRMYAELLESNIDSSYLPEESQKQVKSHHFLAVIINESQRLSRLIENVLSFNKVQKRRFNMNTTEGNVDDCIDNVILNFAPVFKQKQLSVQFNKNASETVCFDPYLLEQILNNLLSNVEKYASQGKRIKIDSMLKNNYIIIEVRDYGPGIDNYEQKKIFQPFYRSSAKLTEGISGAGIGLAISLQLAKLHGGNLDYKQTDKGACFVVQLMINPREDS